MAITQKEADELELLFMNAMPELGEGDGDNPKKAKEAWDYLLSFMERENNYTDHFGIESIDWQIGNWANDTAMALHNAKLYEEEIQVNQQILRIDWGDSTQLFHDNAKRDIADAYADMRDYEKCFNLYDGYLQDDPLWGWAWIGYFRHLKDTKNEKFEMVLNDLYQRIQSGDAFRDMEDLCRELGDEYEELGDKDSVVVLRRLEDKEKMVRRGGFARRGINHSDTMTKKIYPNEPCPCGSGKKYKKCCGRK